MPFQGARPTQIVLKEQLFDHNPAILKSGYEELSEVLNDKDIIQFSDYDEFLKSDIDAVIVATEAVYHVPIVIKAFDAGKHVLCEIPSVNSVVNRFPKKI